MFHLWLYHDLFNSTAEHAACFQYLMSIFMQPAFSVFQMIFIFTMDDQK